MLTVVAVNGVKGDCLLVLIGSHAVGVTHGLACHIVALVVTVESVTNSQEGEQ